MPLYEYQCESCQHRFEQIQKYTDPPPAACPVCGGSVRKLMSSPAIQFKGTGWYITDYAKKSGADAGKAGGAKGDSSAKSDASGKSDNSGNSENSGKSESSSSDSGSTAKADAPATPKAT